MTSVFTAGRTFSSVSTLRDCANPWLRTTSPGERLRALQGQRVHLIVALQALLTPERAVVFQEQETSKSLSIRPGDLLPPGPRRDSIIRERVWSGSSNRADREDLGAGQEVIG